MAREKSKKQIIAQSKRLQILSKGNAARKARIKEIESRYVANIENQPSIKAFRNRNDYLRSLRGTNPTWKHIRDTYVSSGLGKEPAARTARDVDERYKVKDKSLNGLIGLNTAKINNRRFSRNQYMYGTISNAKANSNG